MWRTQDGIRKLQGAEARLVRAAAVTLYEHLKNCGEPHQIGARAFDRISLDQQMFAVLAVAQRLTDDLRPMPLDAWAEATVYAIFEYIHDVIACEIEISEDPHEEPLFLMRRLARDAFLDQWPDAPEDVPSAESKDLRDWDFAILCLTDCILWDRDFLDEDVYDGSDSLPDYFVAQPPEWTPLKKRDLLNFYEQAVSEANRLAA